MNIEKIIIHCSATPNGRYHNAEDIHRWHKERGWDGIGYHYVITTKGEMQQGRPEFWKGSHALKHNNNSIGICLIGTDEYNQDQWSVLTRLLTGLTSKHINAKIIGHNEVSDKKCPGFDVQWWLKNKFYKRSSENESES